MATKVISYTDTDEDHIMHSNSDNIEVMTYHKAKDSDEDPSESFLSRYQIGLEIIMAGIDFTFDFVNLIYYKCYKLNFKRDGWYIDSLKKGKNNIKSEIWWWYMFSICGNNYAWL